MPILFGAFLSLLIAWARGVPPLALSAVRLHWLLLPPIAFGLQLLAFDVLEGSIGATAPLWQLLSMGLLLAFLIRNVHYRALGIVAFGTALNLLVVTLNGGYMPADPDHLRAAGFPQVASRLETQGHFQKTGRRTAETRLPLLGDVIQLPLPGPDRLISVGDVLVGAGVFLFVQEALMPLRKGRKLGEWTRQAPQAPQAP